MNAPRVYLVATGLQNGGEETYTRHDRPVPMADYETLVPVASVVAIEADAARLREALAEAAQSLETLARLSGRPTYGNPPIESFMGHFDEVRGYAGSRARVAREALAESATTGTGR